MSDITEYAHGRIARIAHAAVYGIDYERFAELREDDMQDELHPDAFANALELECLDDVSAADISDALYSAMSEERSKRYDQLLSDGLI